MHMLKSILCVAVLFESEDEKGAAERRMEGECASEATTLHRETGFVFKDPFLDRYALGFEWSSVRRVKPIGALQLLPRAAQHN